MTSRCILWRAVLDALGLDKRKKPATLSDDGLSDRCPIGSEEGIRRHHQRETLLVRRVRPRPFFSGVAGG